MEDLLDDAESNNRTELPTEEEILNPGVRETLVIDENQILRMAPAEGNTPLSILLDEECIFLAFVKVFYGHKLETPRNVSRHAMYKSLIRRAATRPDLLLHIYE